MKKTMFAIMLVVLMVPSLAFAATGGPMSTAFGDVIEIVGYTLLLLFMALLSVAARWIAAKFKVQVPDAWMSSANTWLDKGIHYAEEWGKNKIANSETINGNDKLNTAAQFVLNMADDKKLVAMSEEKIKKLIEARLGEHRGITTELTAGLSGTTLGTIMEAQTATLEPIQGQPLQLLPPVVHSIIATDGGHTIVMNDGTTKPLDTKKEG